MAGKESESRIPVKAEPRDPCCGSLFRSDAAAGPFVHWGIIPPEQRWPRDEPVDCDRGGERNFYFISDFNVIDNGTATPLGALYVQWVK